MKNLIIIFCSMFIMLGCGSHKLSFNDINPEFRHTYTDPITNIEIRLQSDDLEWEFASNSVWIGKKINGKKDGVWRSYWSNGNLHYEETYKDGKDQGPFKYYWSNGELSSEGFYWNKKHVTQEFYEKKKQYYEKVQYIDGCSSGDCENGYGTYTSEDGDKYVGEWKDGKKHGKGAYTFLSYVTKHFTEPDYYEDAYVGEWKDGKKHGKGVYTFSDGSKKEGLWVNDDFIKE